MCCAWVRTEINDKKYLHNYLRWDINVDSKLICNIFTINICSSESTYFRFMLVYTIIYKNYNSAFL